ncbi:hypothetical protein [Gimesia maris]|uniref:hypothetical protein n=1 Tax=Gimesia maris TaxID=122 RepID=UPI000E920338|nr:hypothetical protein [Gimesia maris]HAW32825.1 hypothetical protein [Planctomycetaceae bacterium]|tara:strand:- start:218 stop:721 length:504 start_codon:yes stop_codon:yes gene_type:complete
MNNDLLQKKKTVFYASKWFFHSCGTLAFLIFGGFMIWPFYVYPPAHREDTRTLRTIYAMTPQLLEEQDRDLTELNGPVQFEDAPEWSQTSNCPFIWFTQPASGDLMQVLHPRFIEPEARAADFVERFYVAARLPDGHHGRWVLMNTGESRYVKGAWIQWDTQTIVEQ